MQTGVAVNPAAAAGNTQPGKQDCSPASNLLWLMRVPVRLWLCLQENGTEQTVTVVEDGEEREVTVIIARNDQPETITVRAAGAAGSSLRS